jgi:hypothetical protein
MKIKATKLVTLLPFIFLLNGKKNGDFNDLTMKLFITL